MFVSDHMKGFASITLAMRITMSLIILVSVWWSFNNYVETMKNVEMSNRMQDVAEYIEAKVLYSLKMLQNPEYAFLKEKIYLPDLREYYSPSLSCSPDNVLQINASMPARGINFIIRDYINCSNMDLSGSLLPNGERCISANRTGLNIKITLVNNCGSV